MAVANFKTTMDIFIIAHYLMDVTLASKFFLRCPGRGVNLEIDRF